MISLGIAERFRQINEYLNESFQNSANKVFYSFKLAMANNVKYFNLQLGTLEFWRLIRNHFGLVCEILELVDEKISGIVILSCLANLYFICLQVLNIMV